LVKGPVQIILSFDVEEHHLIEAASGLRIEPSLEAHYRARLEPEIHWLLNQLAKHEIKATFFIVGRIAQHSPGLVQAIHRAGHEVASHSWEHRRVHNFDPVSFRDDVRKSRDALEQVTGEPVVGYRAPTFSVVRQTAWALDVLAESGLLYDSSIYPVHHDRYGVPHAPRAPFRARGEKTTMLEMPPATLRLLDTNIPVGGGGYFRLFPLVLLKRALQQIHVDCHPPVAMLYFHPWEFDPAQPRLPLSFVRRFRTYVGVNRTQARLRNFLSCHDKRCFWRAVDVARRLDPQTLPVFDVG
jgi:polysaccharide deacetylase family protein (PEP-CTERM system associated)